MHALLNDLEALAADIINVYLQAPTLKNHYEMCVLEFCLENVGKVAIVKRSAHEGKSVGRGFRNHSRSRARY